MSRPHAARGSERAADLTVLGLLAGFVLLYCVDAVRASTAVLNLILVLPVSVLVLALCAVQFVLSVTADKRAARHGAGLATSPRVEGPERALEGGTGATSDLGALTAAGLFSLYVLTLPWLGFDIGTMLFLGAFLRLQGERRWLWLVGYSIAFGMALSYAFSRLLPYDMPLRLLGVA